MTAGMVFCCRVAGRVPRSVVACSRASNPLASTPVVGRVDQRSAHHTRHLRAEEVARPWTGRPGNRAIQGSRGSATSRPGSRPDRHGSPRQPRRSNLTILSESLGQIKSGHLLVPVRLSGGYCCGGYCWPGGG